MVNEIVIVGRLCKEPQLQMTKSEKMLCDFQIAVNSYDKTAMFFSAMAFNQKADFITKYLHKGDLVGITGSLMQKKFIINNETKSRVYILVERIDLISKKETDKKPVENDASTQTISIENDEELPF